MKCTKCFRPLHDCQDCKGGRTNLTCSKCQTTGQVCPNCGGHWK